ncbi:MAG: PAS domain S-box protein [Deltaproteobacteria bacterium]|nr:PAS domain S-box protein [Deltaproteobacteria bacterium]
MNDPHGGPLEADPVEFSLDLAPEAVRSLFLDHSAVMLLIDPESLRILEANQAALKFYGYTRQELLARRAPDLNTLPETEVRQRVDQVGAEGQGRFRFTHALADGRRREVDVESTAIPLEDGRLVLFSLVRDVTAEVEARAALAASEERYRRLVELAQEGIWELDPQGRLTFVNPKLAAMLDREPAELWGQPLARFLSPGEHQAHELSLASHRELRHGEYERRFRRRDGEEICLRVTATALNHPDGTPAGSFALASDITARQKAERELRKSRELFQRAFAAAPVWMVLSNLADGRYLEVNASFLEETGFTREEVLGRSSLDLGTWDDPADRERMVATLRQTGRVRGREVVRRTKDGRPLTMLFSGELVTIDGEPCLLSISQDITRLKEQEEERRRLLGQMQNLQKLESLGMLAGGLAHEFNNILMGVLGQTGLALMDLPGESPAVEHLLAVEAAAKRLAELTNQLLAYAGKGKFLISSLDLSGLTQDMLDLVKTVVTKKAVVRCNLAPDLPRVEGDASQLQQVVMNLVTNASDALEDHQGTITLTTGVVEADAGYLAGTFLEEDLPAGTYVFLEVSDTGRGMDPATRANLCDPFFSTKFTGRGLGMAAVLGIVRGHKGALKVYSEVNSGTTVKVLLPAAPVPAAQAASEAPGARAGDRATVLVVDDEEMVRDVAALSLERLGCRVWQAVDGLEALELYGERLGEIGLVILDLTMPRMNGVETFANLRRLSPEVRVLLSSGYNEEETVTRFAGKGLAGFIQKPYTPKQLMEKVRGILARDLPA